MDNSDQPNQNEDLIKWKIFPRNLTARADYMVTGNPMSSRPESTVGNCFPGLEFDDRNIEKAFFPGLLFEFHRDDGAILYSLKSGSTAANSGLTDRDLWHYPDFTEPQGRAQRTLYLWGIYGLMSSSANNGNMPEFVSCAGMNGPNVLRLVRDLRPGWVLIMIGPAPTANSGGLSAPFYIAGPMGSTSSQSFPLGLNGADNLLEFLQEHFRSKNSVIFRDPPETGPLSYAFFVGEREEYVDDDGILNVTTYPPGELTRTMCTPWQYDYRDCGCYYWAASKPDMVAGSELDENNEPKYPYLNYQRRDRGSDTAPPPTDVPLPPGRGTEITHGEMFDAWNDVLPVVLNDRESEQKFVPPPTPPVPDLWNRQKVIDELHYLATVEHALCVEYLYAHYSLNAPKELPKKPEPDDQTRRIFAAAHEIFMIATDEMRHFHWVNEVLSVLGSPPSLDRATYIGRTFNRKFSLDPLTPEQLQWFIDVEKPSRSLSEQDQIDGMYVRLHTSIDKQPQKFPEHDILVHLIKLIIDEGGDHYHRFMSIQRHLDGIPPEKYLRQLKDAQEGSNLAMLQDLSDTHYATVLGILAQTFSLGEKAGGILLKNAVKEMFNLHDTNHILASEGIRPRFNSPTIVAPSLPMSAKAAHVHVDQMASALNDSLSQIKQKGENQHKKLAERQGKISNDLFDLIHKLVTEDKGE